MEVTRRNFVQLLAGFVAGLQITPLPWKLIDDIAIWTQNWPWVPVPPDGEFSHVKSICKLCPGGCGIEVRKAGHRAVKIEGRTDFPVNPGGICSLGMGGLQLLYNEDYRFRGPMKRAGARGSGVFVDITWEEAVNILASRIASLRKNGKPEAVTAIDGNPPASSMSVMVDRLLRSIGSPNYLRIPTMEETHRIAGVLMQGNDGPTAYDLENADFVLSFGSGLIEGWGSAGRVINAWRLWHEGGAQNTKTKVVQVESRASNTASKSDQWMAPKPGTEAALALGIAYVLITERLYDYEFVSNYCFGFNDWASEDGTRHQGFRSLVLQKYSPSRVAQITGLGARDIVRVAREFGRAKAPLALCGKGKGLLSGSVLESMAVLSLNALRGRINKPGGILVHQPLPLGSLPEIEMDLTSLRGLDRPRMDGAGTAEAPFTHSLISNLTDAVLEADQSPVDTMLVFSSNPVFTLPRGSKFQRTLEETSFIVSFSPYRDETAYMSDLILPDHTYLEKQDDVVWPSGLQYPFYGLTRPVVDPVYNTRNTGDVIIQVAKRIGGTVGQSFPWKGYGEVLKERAKGLYDSLTGLTSYDASSPTPWKRIKESHAVTPDYDSFDDLWRKMKYEGGMWYRPAHSFGNQGGIFNTPTGKFEFFSSALERALKKRPRNSLWLKAKGDEAFMPHFEEAYIPEQESGYPLIMVPYEMINLASGWTPGPPFQKKTLTVEQLREGESFADINPRTASKYGLAQGDRIVLESPGGEVRVRVNIFEGAMPGIVYLPLGFGHTAYDEFLKGKGTNPHHLVHEARDPVSGHPVWWRTPVKLRRA